MANEIRVEYLAAPPTRSRALTARVRATSGGIQAHSFDSLLAARRQDVRASDRTAGGLLQQSRRTSGLSSRASRRTLSTVGSAMVASAALRAPIGRVAQRDPAEYRSAQQAAAWGPSACSAAALTAVLRSRGSAARVADVIDRLGPAIDRGRGLLDRTRLSAVANDLGLPTTVRGLDYAELRVAVASGQPVLTDVTNAQFPEGHWLVVTGVDEAGVSVVDSSGYALTRIDRQTFERSWSHSALVVGSR